MYTKVVQNQSCMNPETCQLQGHKLKVSIGYIITKMANMDILFCSYML